MYMYMLLEATLLFQKLCYVNHIAGENRYTLEVSDLIVILRRVNLSRKTILRKRKPTCSHYVTHWLCGVVSPIPT